MPFFMLFLGIIMASYVNSSLALYEPLKMTKNFLAVEKKISMMLLFSRVLKGP